MALTNTNLVIEAAPLPPSFQGTPQQLFEAMIARMQIKSPAGASFFVIGGTEPTSNQGPWLKDGKKWYVWSDADKKYIPLDITDSLQAPFIAGEEPPANGIPPLWLRTSGTVPVGWYLYIDSNWAPMAHVIQAGPSSERPSNPVELQRYYDTDISTEIWWERGAWRTVAGSPGDVKFVIAPTLADALRFNPGWIYIGESVQAFRGRALVIATKDAGATPEAEYTPMTGIEPRAAHEYWGEDAAVDEGTEMPYPAFLALWCLVKT